MDNEKKTYIAIFRIGGDPGELMAKVRIAAPAVLKNIERISNGEFLAMVETLLGCFALECAQCFHRRLYAVACVIPAAGVGSARN